MTDWLIAILVCAAFVIAGRRWVGWIAPISLSLFPELALGYLIGTALVTLGMLGVALIGLPVDRLTLALSFVLVWRFAPKPAAASAGASPVPGRLRLPGMACLGLAAAAVGFGMIEAFRLGPIDTVDFQKAWGLKAVAVAHDHSMDFSHITSPNLFYPLEYSNVNAAVLLALGHLNDSVLRLPAALFGLALPLAIWPLLRLLLSPAAAAAALALAVSAPEFTRQMTSGLADVAVAGYVTLCVLAAYLWLRGGTADWAALSGFAAGAAAWTKLEGGPTCLVVLAAVMVVRRAIRSPGIGSWLAWFGVFFLPWQVFQRLHGIPPNRAHFKSLHLDPIWIVHHVTSTLAETVHWGVFWPLSAVVILITAPLWWRTDTRLLAAVTLPNVFLTLLAYVTHYRGNEAGSVAATAHRLYIHLAPSIAVLVVCSVVAARSVARLGPAYGGFAPRRSQTTLHL